MPPKNQEYYLAKAEGWIANAQNIIGFKNTEQCLRYAEIYALMAMAVKE